MNERLFTMGGPLVVEGPDKSQGGQQSGKGKQQGETPESLMAAGGMLWDQNVGQERSFSMVYNPTTKQWEVKYEVK